MSHFPIYLQTIGEFKLLINKVNHTHYLPYDKAKLLLVLLVLTKQPMSRTALAEMLWPDTDIEKGRARVRHALYLLRQSLAPYSDELFVITQTEIAFNAHLISVDFFDFLTSVDQISSKSIKVKVIKQKLDLYSLGFLQNIKIPPSDTLASWHQSWQSRYELELAQYRHQLVTYYIEAQDISSALTYVKWWLCQTPKDEACHRYLIRLLLVTGDKESALRAYQHCKEMLESTFGTQPSLETQALFQLPLNKVQSSFIPVSGVDSKILCPIATVAIVVILTPATDLDLSLHEITTRQLQQLGYWQEKLQQLCIDQGGWVSQNNEITFLAHFGYPGVVERPIEHALSLVQKIRQLSPAAGLQIKQAIHACAVLLDDINADNVDAVMAQHVLPLVWQAQGADVLLSAQAAARLTDVHIDKVSRPDQLFFRLDCRQEPRLATTRIFGRMHYFDRLVQQWARYIPGQPPAFILLKGSAGLGKTQLAASIADYVQHVGGRVLWLSSDEMKTAEPYHALTELLSKPVENTKTAEAVLTEFFAFLAEYQSAEQPLCLIWDNLQWADSHSLALLEKLSQVQTSKIAVILGLTRYDTSYPWPTTQLKLAPLDTSTVAAYLNHHSKTRKINLKVKQFILRSKIDNPRYINDILHLADLKLPYKELPRIIDLVAAKLHALSVDSQHLVFLGALLPYLSEEAMRAILGLTQADISEKLYDLSGYGFFTHEAIEGSGSLELIKLAILRLIPANIKKELCQKIARFLILKEKPSASVAHYLHIAKSPDTIHWWQKAVQDALDSGSTEKAVDYIYQALISQEYIVDPALREIHAFENHATLANIAIATKGPAAATVIAAYEDAAKNSHDEDLLQSCAIFWGQWVAQHGLGHFAAARLAAQRLQQTAQSAKHDAWLGWSYYAQAQCYLWQGQPEQSEAMQLQAITTINLAVDSELTTGFMGGRSYALAYGALGLTQAILGRYNPALQNAKHAIHLAQQSKAPVSIVMCRLHLLRIYYLTNNLVALEQESESTLRAIPIKDTTNVWYNFVWFYGVVAVHLRKPSAELLVQLEQVRNSIEKNMPSGLESYLCTLARCYLASSQTEKALATLKEAKALAEKNDSLLLVPEIHCLQGDALLALGHSALAQAEWEIAKKIAHEQQLVVYLDWLNERLPPEG